MNCCNFYLLISEKKCRSLSDFSFGKRAFFENGKKFDELKGEGQAKNVFVITTMNLFVESSLIKALAFSELL